MAALCKLHVCCEYVVFCKCRYSLVEFFVFSECGDDYKEAVNSADDNQLYKKNTKVTKDI